MYRRKGQSILEYVIVLTAIIAAIVFAASTFVRNSVVNSLSNVQASITTSTCKIANIQ